MRNVKMLTGAHEGQVVQMRPDVAANAVANGTGEYTDQKPEPILHARSIRPAADVVDPYPDAPGQTVADQPKHLGGGWYELPGGERVKGKAKAMKALRDGKAG